MSLLETRKKRGITKTTPSIEERRKDHFRR
jgi:hypothetical protein